MSNVIKLPPRQAHGVLRTRHAAPGGICETLTLPSGDEVELWYSPEQVREQINDLRELLRDANDMRKRASGNATK